MTQEFILLWFVGTAGVMAGVITFHYWLERRYEKKRERIKLLKRLREV